MTTKYFTFLLPLLAGCSSSTAPHAPLADGIQFAVTAEAILAHDGSVLIPLSGDPSRGAPEAFKRRGLADFYLVPVGDALQRADRGGRAAGVAIEVDGSTSYRLLEELLATSQYFGSPRLRLHGAARGIDLALEAPAQAGAAVAPHSLSMMILPSGVSLRSAGGAVGPGCASIGPGVALSRSAQGEFRPNAVANCAKQIGFVAAGGVKTVALQADPATPFDELAEVVAPFAAEGWTFVPVLAK